LTTSNIASVVSQISTGNQSIPQSVTCGNCSKASYIIASTNFPDLVSGSKSQIQNTCGTAFTGVFVSVLVQIRNLVIFSSST